MKSLLSFSACALLASALTCATASARDLDVAAASVKKAEIRYGQIGPRDTLIFYTFADQDAVLQLNIKHEAGKFTLSGKMQLFKEGTGAEGLGKWINNQHSCGLFPEVPKPTASVALAAEACSVMESKLNEAAEINPGPSGGKFQDFTLKIKVADIEAKEFTLKGFTVDSGAFVKVGPAA